MPSGSNVKTINDFLSLEPPLKLSYNAEEKTLGNSLKFKTPTKKCHFGSNKIISMWFLARFLPPPPFSKIMLTCKKYSGYTGGWRVHSKGVESEVGVERSYLLSMEKEIRKLRISPNTFLHHFSSILTAIMEMWFIQYCLCEGRAAFTKLSWREPRIVGCRRRPVRERRYLYNCIFVGIFWLLLIFSFFR